MMCILFYLTCIQLFTCLFTFITGREIYGQVFHRSRLETQYQTASLSLCIHFIICLHDVFYSCFQFSRSFDVNSLSICISVWSYFFVNVSWLSLVEVQSIKALIFFRILYRSVKSSFDFNLSLHLSSSDPRTTIWIKVSNVRSFSAQDVMSLFLLIFVITGSWTLTGSVDSHGIQFTSFAELK